METDLGKKGQALANVGVVLKRVTVRPTAQHKRHACPAPMCADSFRATETVQAVVPDACSFSFGGHTMDERVVG